MAHLTSAWDGPLFGQLAIVWLLFLVSWAIARGGMRALSRHEPRPAPATGTVAMDRRPRIGSLGALRLIAGCVLMAVAGLALVAVLRQVFDRGDAVTVLVIMVPLLVAVTVLERAGRALLLHQLGAGRSRPPAVSLGAGNTFLAGLALGFGGWLLLRTHEKRVALADFLHKVPFDLERTSLDGANVVFGWTGLSLMLLGHALLIAAQRRRRNTPHPAPCSMRDAGRPLPRSDTEARLAAARRLYRGGRGGYWLIAGGRATIGIAMVLAGTPLLFIGFAPEVVADWQLVGLGLFGAVSFVAALRWSM